MRALTYLETTVADEGRDTTSAHRAARIDITAFVTTAEKYGVIFVRAADDPITALTARAANSPVP